MTNKPGGNRGLRHYWLKPDPRAPERRRGKVGRDCKNVTVRFASSSSSLEIPVPWEFCKQTQNMISKEFYLSAKPEFPKLPILHLTLVAASPGASRP